MKLERLFEVKESKLYTVEGKPVQVEDKAFPVKWSDVEAGDAIQYVSSSLGSGSESLRSASTATNSRTLWAVIPTACLIMISFLPTCQPGRRRDI